MPLRFSGWRLIRQRGGTREAGHSIDYISQRPATTSWSDPMHRPGELHAHWAAKSQNKIWADLKITFIVE